MKFFLRYFLGDFVLGKNRFLFFLLIFFVLFGVCFGVDVAVVVDPANSSKTDEAFSLGYVFTVNSSIRVTHLGRFDADGRFGNTGDKLVRLYNFDSGDVISSETVSIYTLGELTGGVKSHFVAIEPVVLKPGTRYFLATEVSANESLYGNGIASWPGGGVKWIAGRSTAVGSPAMPGKADANTFPQAGGLGECYFGPNFKYESTPCPAKGSIAISQPKSRCVFQRNDANIAMVEVEGFYSGSASKIEARAVVMEGFEGTATDWQVISDSPVGGKFSGALAVSAGGWYSIEVRMFEGEKASDVAAVDRVGVGEVFVTAGQSNSANHGSPGFTPTKDTVSAWMGGSDWRHGYDPQPGATGGGGSAWSRLGEMLSDELKVPIGFISCGVGGARVDQWVPGAVFYPRLRLAIKSAGPNGIRAVLWHQGESDSISKTTAEEYAKRLNSIIRQSRIDSGLAVPWGIAIASYHPATSSQEENPIRKGQEMVIAGDALVFRGADTDSFGALGYLCDGVHFNNEGLYEHALRWKEAILKYSLSSSFKSIKH